MHRLGRQALGNRQNIWRHAVDQQHDGHAAHNVMELTEGAGVGEAVGLPVTFDVCQAIVAADGRIANVGIPGNPAEPHMEKLWDRNILIKT